MPFRKRTSPAAGGDSEGATDPADATAPGDAVALAEEAEADAALAEAEAAAARARARALKLRHQAEAAAAASAETPAADESTTPDEADPETKESDAAATDDDADVDVDEPESEPERRRRRLPSVSAKTVLAGLVVAVSLGLLAVSGWMILQHREVAAEQQRSAEFAAAARQGVVTLMSLDFNRAEEDVKRILDNTTGDFRKDFESQAADFTTVAQESKVVTEATVNATAVATMSRDTATVLVAVTTNVSNAASSEQEPRSWRLSVDVARDGGQIKLAKVEFVP